MDKKEYFMSENLRKSVFVLYVYKYCGYGEKLAYRIDEADLRSSGHALVGK